MITKKVFLASCAELKEDRRDLEVFINRKNKDWVAHGVFLELVIREDFFDEVSQTRLRDEYHRAICDCDLVVMLFATKVGRFTQEEFETAFGRFQETNRPFIFTYFKDAPLSTGSADRADLTRLWAFQDRLQALGHCYTLYQGVADLSRHFSGQLDKLAANGFITFTPDQAARAGAADTSYQATQGGSGAIAELLQLADPGRPPAHPRRPAPLRRATPARRPTGPGRPPLGLHRPRPGRRRLWPLHRRDEVRAAHRPHRRRPDPARWPG